MSAIQLKSSCGFGSGRLHGSIAPPQEWDQAAGRQESDQAGTGTVLDGPEQLELALHLFREDSLIAKREARRRKYFVAPSASRKIKSIAARKRATRNRH